MVDELPEDDTELNWFSAYNPSTYSFNYAASASHQIHDAMRERGLSPSDSECSESRRHSTPLTSNLHTATAASDLEAKKWRCATQESCLKQMKKKYDWQQHDIRVHGPELLVDGGIRYKCGHCDPPVITTYKSALKRHMQSQHSHLAASVPYVVQESNGRLHQEFRCCPICGQFFETLDQRHCHLSKEHLDKYFGVWGRPQETWNPSVESVSVQRSRYEGDDRGDENSLPEPSSDVNVYDTRSGSSRTNIYEAHPSAHQAPTYPPILPEELNSYHIIRDVEFEAGQTGKELSNGTTNRELTMIEPISHDVSSLSGNNSEVTSQSIMPNHGNSQEVTGVLNPNPMIHTRYCLFEKLPRRMALSLQNLEHEQHWQHYEVTASKPTLQTAEKKSISAMLAVFEEKIA